MSQEISPENQAVIENLHVLIARAEEEIDDLDNLRQAKKRQIKEWRKAIWALSPKPKAE
jgi:uncharacterized protein HemX